MTPYSRSVWSCLAVAAWGGLAAGCNTRSSTEPGAIETKSAALFSSDPGTVTPGAPVQRTASCPGKRFPDQCGSWEGVELKASPSSDDQRCLCRSIAFQVPASLPVTKGNAGTGDASLTFRKAGALKKCIYHGNARCGKSGKQTGGDAYELVNCTDQSKAGSAVTADWFSLEVNGGDKSKGPTEVSLRLGAPDVVNGVVQEEIVYSGDTRIPSAALHIPRGSAPPNQEFSLTVLPQPPVGTSIPNGDDPAVTLGYAVDVHATGVAQFAFADIAGAACPRIDLPYSPAALAAFAGPGAEGLLRARQIKTLTGLTSGASVLARTSDVTVDPVNHLVSFCVAHLSYYVPSGSQNNADLTGAYLTTSPVRSCATAATCNAGEVCNGNCYVDLLAAWPPPPLMPGSPYVLHLDFHNIGMNAWSAASVHLYAVDPAAGIIPAPWSANVPQSIGSTDIPRFGNASFDVSLTSPMTKNGAQLDLCLVNGTAPIGECFSWESSNSAVHDGTGQAPILEICDGVDNDSNTITDDVNGDLATAAGAPCDNGQTGPCRTTGVYVCDGLFATRCNAPNVTPSADVCDGVDNDCDGVVDDGCPGGLACGTVSGMAACQCPPHVGGDFYVDPVAGSDAAGLVFPTGVQDPPACRFATLGKALSLATASGDRVLATTSAANLPATFLGETFPLSVLDGVTLGTADATPTPSNYTIVAGPLVLTPIVALADGATFTGFTVSVFGSAGSKAVSLGSGSIVDTVRLDGNQAALTTGVFMSGAGPSFVSGAVIDGFAMGVDISSGELSIAGSTIQNGTGWGISQGGGMLTIGTTTVIGNLGGGVSSQNGTLTVDGGSRFDGNGGSGLSSNSSAIVINGSASAPISASANDGEGISVLGGSLSASYLTLDGNGTGVVKASGLRIRGLTSVTLGVAADAAVVSSNNGLHGVHIDGTLDRSNVKIERALITANVGDGIYIDLNGGPEFPGSSATIATSTISGNSGSGVRVVRASTLEGVTSLVLDTLTVTNSGAFGLYLHGAAGIGDITAFVRNSTISANAAAGVRIDSTATSTTQEVFLFNDISLNNGNGIEFAGINALDGFIGNSIHANVGDQISITGRQAGNPTYIFSNPSSTPCDANRNRIYCYGPSNVGVRVAGPPAIPVDARNVSWKNPAPTFATDYIVISSSTLDATNACPPITTCP